MKTYVGLDVSQDSIAVCVIDGDGQVLCEETIHGVSNSIEH